MTGGQRSARAQVGVSANAKRSTGGAPSVTPVPDQIANHGSPVPSPASAFVNLLRIESEARRAPSIRDLDGLFVNDARKLLRVRQAVLVDVTSRSPVVVAMSGLPVVDRTTPMVRWLESLAATMSKEQSLDRVVVFELPGYAPPHEALTREYPFRFCVWQPFWSPAGRNTLGSLLFSDVPLVDADMSVALRLGETFGHARDGLIARGKRTPASKHRRRLWLLAAGVVSLASWLPVPLSVLAPLEVAPRNAEVVAAPIAGIVKSVLVSPNAAVKAGAPLAEFIDVEQRNRVAVVEQEVAVAAARAEKATSLAFTDVRGRQEMGLARAELALKQAELVYARQMLAQTVLRAERDGIAVFSDRRDLEGRPFGIGERLMLIARERDAEIKVFLPVSDSIVLKSGLRVKAFLDSDPLNAIEAKIAHLDFQARLDPSKTAVYLVTARIEDGRAVPPLGTRGTAQIIGERAPLFLFVLRRPLAALRQRLGL